MKTKSKYSKQRCSSRPRTSALRLKSCFCIFPFSFLACCFLTSLAGTAISSEKSGPTNLPVPHLAETPQDANAPNVPSTSNSQLRQQLWQARINIPKGEKDQRSKSELKRIIEQIGSVELEPEKQTPEPVIVVEPVPTTEPNETLPTTEVPNEPAEIITEPKPPYEQVSEHTLQMVENILQHPEQVVNPFELGEVLFLSGNTKEAAIFYQEALNHKDANDVWSAQDKAWISFQIGNCLRNDDLPTAKKMYKQVIAEHPDSPWTDLAKAQHELTDWYQKDKPWTLIEKSISTEIGVLRE
ncbi:MAG: tetratricopeptide repeat protein [Planctomycetota bacterium]|jgi:tetratricopeptide (TPR) repeat protein